MKEKETDPVHGAVMVESLTDLVRALDGGADVDARDREGRTALFYAAMDGLLAIAAELIRRGADPSAHDRNAWGAASVRSPRGLALTGQGRLPRAGLRWCRMRWSRVVVWSAVTVAAFAGCDAGTTTTASDGVTRTIARGTGGSAEAAGFDVDVAVVERDGGAPVAGVQFGFVRGDGRTVYARADGTQFRVSAPSRDGELVFVHAAGHALTRLPVADLLRTRRVELGGPVRRVRIERPAGMRDGEPVRVSGGLAVDGKWLLERTELRWSSPIRRAVEFPEAQLPLELEVPDGMVLRISVDVAGAEVIPPTIQLRSGESAIPSVLRMRRIVVTDPDGGVTEDLLLLPDCLSTPGYDDLALDALAGRMAQPGIGSRDPTATAVWDQVPPCALHAFVRTASALRYARVPEGMEDERLDSTQLSAHAMLPRLSEEDAALRSGVVAMPGRLDLSAAILLMDHDRRLRTGWTRRIEPGADARDAVWPGADCVTLWSDTLGVCHVPAGMESVGPSDWCHGSITLRFPRDRTFTGNVGLMSDWQRTGRMRVHSDPRSLRRALDAQPELRFSGLPVGAYQIEVVGRVRGPDGETRCDLVRRTVVGEGEGGAVTLELGQ